MFGIGASPAQVQPPAVGRWRPTRHAKDDWFDQIPGQHRLLFDSLSVQGVRYMQVFATNYFATSKREYGLDSTELAVVACMRHLATPFAFGDAIWTKYGPALAESIKFTDPDTSRWPTVNVYRQSLEALVKRGLHIAVCDTSTHGFANEIARKTGGNADAVYREITASVIGDAHFVTAGIVAINRAQERGYSIAYVG